MYEDYMFSLLKRFNRMLRAVGSHMYSGSTAYLNKDTKYTLMMPLKMIKYGKAKLLGSTIPISLIDITGKGICNYYRNFNYKIKFCSLWDKYLDVLNIINYCMEGIFKVESVLSVTDDGFIYPVGFTFDCRKLIDYEGSLNPYALVSNEYNITRSVKNILSGCDIKVVTFRPFDATLDLSYNDGSLLRLSHCGKAYKVRKVSEDTEILKGIKFISLYNQIATLIKGYEPLLMAYKCISIDLNSNSLEVFTNEELFNCQRNVC